MRANMQAPEEEVRKLVANDVGKVLPSNRTSRLERFQANPRRSESSAVLLTAQGLGLTNVRKARKGSVATGNPVKKRTARKLRQHTQKRNVSIDERAHWVRLDTIMTVRYSDSKYQ